jgi:hypothetical protein
MWRADFAVRCCPKYPAILDELSATLTLPDYGRVARQSPGTHTGLTRSSEVALKAVSRLHARWTIRVAVGTLVTQRPPHGSGLALSNGEIPEPCGVPFSVFDHTPSSSTPALSHFLIRRRIRRSPIRCWRNLTIHSCEKVPKQSRMSASSTQFTFFLMIPTASASNASCVPRPGRKPYENPKKSSS